MIVAAAAAVVGGVARARDLNCPWYSPPLLLLMLSDISIIVCALCYTERESERDRSVVFGLLFGTVFGLLCPSIDDSVYFGSLVAQCFPMIERHGCCI
mmetsp:Transcript_4421/g.6644  ORF Transcript_4421/g.6644 Transcript_4421/m.6644 type:complete len:98 (+) Transcript_4421:640-933(+)